MIAGLVLDIGAVLSAAALLTLAASVWLLVWRKGFKSLDIEVAGLHAQLQGVQAQFRNNGGSSMRDVIDEIRSEQQAIKAMVSDHGDELARLADAGRAIAERVTTLEGEEAA